MSLDSEESGDYKKNTSLWIILPAYYEVSEQIEGPFFILG